MVNKRLQTTISHHVNFVLIHHDASTKEKGKQELVLFKQTAAHITVQTEGEKFVDVGDSVLQRVCKKHIKKNLVVAITFSCVYGLRFHDICYVYRHYYW